MKTTNKTQTLEKLCNGEMTYYDKDSQLRCGHDLNYINIRCPYYETRYCKNEFYSKTSFKYNKKW